MNGNETDEGPSGQSRARWHGFARTATGTAALLLVAVVAAVVWINIDAASYEKVWGTRLTIGPEAHPLTLPLHEWINSGLMSLFFFVVGLEARREFDMGELRDRRWLLLSVLAGLSSMIVPVLLYLAVNAGRDSAHAWGVAMSTDTAFALGILAVLGPRLPASLRAFLLSISVVDDLVALVVIAVFYSDAIDLMALLVAVLALVAFMLLRMLKRNTGVLRTLLAVVVWVALHEAGVDPVVTGLVIGALVVAYPAPRADLERASALFRRFREQPTAEMHRSAVQGITAAVSPNERLEQRLLPWVSYGVVPLFALANAGVELSRENLEQAVTSPIVLGILVAMLVGKVIGVLAATGAAQMLSRGRLRPNVGWGAVTAGGAISGAAFTVSLLIASLFLEGEELEMARLGVLATLVGALVLGWAVTAVIGLLPARRRTKALLGTAEPLTDLAVPVDARHDHVRGPAEASVTVVEYGDFECPYCGQAEPAVRALLGDETDIRYVWRHLPLTDVHPHAQLAAEVSEAAARQGRFWEMHDVLMSRQDALTGKDLLRYARELDLDEAEFRRDMEQHHGARRVAEDVDSADLSGVTGTPTFFINGRRHRGAYDIVALKKAVKQARHRALALEPQDDEQETRDGLAERGR